MLWHGPLGRAEDERTRPGTDGIVRALAAHAGFTVAGGRETGMAVERLGATGDLTHVSTGGTAFLAYLERGTLPALEALVGA